MLTRSDLWSLEEYAERRDGFRASVLEHKRHRRLLLGEHLLLLFESQMTIRYQVQEMLRIEKIFEAASIQEELNAYNPLIPDGDNLKCSLLIQFTDVAERVVRLKELVGIEHGLWLRIGEEGEIHAVADEDLERSNEEKTSAVHFLRFQLSGEDIAGARAGAALTFGVDHANYHCHPVTLADEMRASLLSDLI